MDNRPISFLIIFIIPVTLAVKQDLYAWNSVGPYTHERITDDAIDETNSHGTVGIGHLYQGRFKSFPVQTNRYYLTLMSYVESNPLRADIVERSVDWPWSSLAIRCGVNKPVILSDGPVELPKRWIRMVDKAGDVSKTDRELLATCVKRSRPMGEKDWTITMAAKLGLESTLRPRGRPRIENNGV